MNFNNLIVSLISYKHKMNNEDLMNSSPDNSAAALNLDDPAHVHSESVDFLEPKSKSPIDFLQTQTMKMYVVYFALIILNIANSLTTSSVNDNDTTTVLLSTIFLVINFMFSLILVTYKQKDDFQKQG